MTYFSVAFHYSGKLYNCPDDSEESHEASVACCAADKAAEILLKSIPGLTVGHEYSFPDGSCYKFVRGDIGKPELEAAIRRRLTLPLVDFNVRETTAEANPCKVGYRSLRTYLNAKERRKE